jgi:hypothetical protein
MAVSRRPVPSGAPAGEGTMGLFILLLILALVFGGVGLVVEGMMWLLIIAAVLFVASFIFYGRGRATV